VSTFGELSKLSFTTRPVSGLMTMMTTYVRKVLLCSAIRLQTQQPTDQKKEGGQEHAECSHRRYSQMDWTEDFRICFVLTPSSNVSTARNTSSEQECSLSEVPIGVRSSQ
jgi:hypothetical protein